MSRPILPELSSCPVGNVCSLSQPGGPQCGTQYDHLSPLLVAEQLCPTALQQKVNDSQAFSSDILDASVLFHTQLAWGRLEQALNPKMPDNAANILLAEAEGHADAALEIPLGGFERRLGAGLLKLEMDAFRGRRPRPEPTEDWGTVTAPGWETIKRGMAFFAADACQAPTHNQKVHPGHLFWPNHRACFGALGYKQHTVANLGPGVLCMEAGLPVYATSPRENTGLAGRGLRFNHDFYGLIDPATKLAVRSSFRPTTRRARPRYGHSILDVNFAALTRTAYRATAAKGHCIGEHQSGTVIPPEETVQWISLVALQQEVSEAEQALVHKMTSLLSRKIRQKRAQFE